MRLTHLPLCLSYDDADDHMSVRIGEVLGAAYPGFRVFIAMSPLQYAMCANSRLAGNSSYKFR